MLSKTYTKYIQSLHQKKFRDAHNSFTAEGTKLVPELLQSKTFECEQLLAKEEWLKTNERIFRKYFDGPVQVVEDFELEKISALSAPNQVVGVFKKTKNREIIVKNKIVLALDTIQDPGNLGTIIRIADWFGIADIVCTIDSVEQYNPKVVQSTMGSLGRVQVSYVNLEAWLQTQQSVQTYAAALNGTDVRTLKGLKEGIIIIGNESKGISEAVMDMAGKKITIPKTGRAESLNAAVATGIILSHLA